MRVRTNKINGRPDPVSVQWLNLAAEKKPNAGVELQRRVGQGVLPCAAVSIGTVVLMTPTDKAGKNQTDVEGAAFRTALIDAAERCYAQRGFQATTMADIAAEAGTSRRTLYRSFPSHDLILNAVIRRSVNRFWERFHNAHKHIEDFSEFLVEAMIYAIRHAPKTKTHSVLYHPASLAMVNKLFIDNPEYLRDQARQFGNVYERTRHSPGTRQDLDMLVVCEWWNRMAVSFQAIPSPFFRSEKDLRSMLAVTLVPVVRSDTRTAGRKSAKAAKKA